MLLLGLVFGLSLRATPPVTGWTGSPKFVRVGVANLCPGPFAGTPNWAHLPSMTAPPLGIDQPLATADLRA